MASVLGQGRVSRLTARTKQLPTRKPNISAAGDQLQTPEVPAEISKLLNDVEFTLDGVCKGEITQSLVHDVEQMLDLLKHKTPLLSEYKQSVRMVKIVATVRGLLRDVDLNPLIKVSLLEMIELSASGWQDQSLECERYYERASIKMQSKQRHFKPGVQRPYVPPDIPSLNRSSSSSSSYMALEPTRPSYVRQKSSPAKLENHNNEETLTVTDTSSILSFEEENDSFKDVPKIHLSKVKYLKGVYHYEVEVNGEISYIDNNLDPAAVKRIEVETDTRVMVTEGKHKKQKVVIIKGPTEISVKDAMNLVSEQLTGKSYSNRTRNISTSTATSESSSRHNSLDQSFEISAKNYIPSMSSNSGTALPKRSTIADTSSKDRKTSETINHIPQSVSSNNFVHKISSLREVNNQNSTVKDINDNQVAEMDHNRVQIQPQSKELNHYRISIPPPTRLPNVSVPPPTTLPDVSIPPPNKVWVDVSLPPPNLLDTSRPPPNMMMSQQNMMMSPPPQHSVSNIQKIQKQTPRRLNSREDIDDPTHEQAEDLMLASWHEKNVNSKKKQESPQNYEAPSVKPRMESKTFTLVDNTITIEAKNQEIIKELISVLRNFFERTMADAEVQVELIKPVSLEQSHAVRADRITDGVSNVWDDDDDFMLMMETDKKLRLQPENGEQGGNEQGKSINKLFRLPEEEDNDRPITSTPTPPVLVPTKPGSPIIKPRLKLVSAVSDNVVVRVNGNSQVDKCYTNIDIKDSGDFRPHTNNKDSVYNSVKNTSDIDLEGLVRGKMEGSFMSARTKSSGSFTSVILEDVPEEEAELLASANVFLSDGDNDVGSRLNDEIILVSDSESHTESPEHIAVRRKGYGYPRPNAILREPIQPFTNELSIEKATINLPRILKSAYHRRKAFNRNKPASLENQQDARHNELRYGRDFLLACANSPMAKKIPSSDWTYLTQVLPDVCFTKVADYFDPANYCTPSRESLRGGPRSIFGNQSDASSYTDFLPKRTASE